MLAVFGAATLAHLLVVSVGRRRQEMGLLKALGFTNGQIRSTVFWQAATVTVIGIVIGIPLGVAIGRMVWRSFAINVGVVPAAGGEAPAAGGAVSRRAGSRCRDGCGSCSDRVALPTEQAPALAITRDCQLAWPRP